MKEKGWTVKHQKYGTWFISRDSVIIDYKKYLEHFDEDIPEEIDEACIDTWFYEQISWYEVHFYGRQLERPDMQVWENYFLKQMKNDTDVPDEKEEV